MHSTGVRFRAGNNPARRGTQTMISATQLYDYVHCPHRVSMDAFGDATERDETSPFVELLWEQGLIHENAIAEGLSITANMKLIDLADRERETLRAMARCEPLIYGGRLTAGDLVGEPDLLEWTGMGYIPGDIKSGSGFEGDESEGRFKKHYAFQLAHYRSEEHTSEHQSRQYLVCR